MLSCLMRHVVFKSSYIQSSSTTILHHPGASTSFQHLSTLLPGHLDIETLNVVHQEIIRISTEIILDESSEVRIQIQQCRLLIPLRPIGEELAGSGVGVESVDEGEVVGTEGGGAVIWKELVARRKKLWNGDEPGRIPKKTWMRSEPWKVPKIGVP